MIHNYLIKKKMFQTTGHAISALLKQIHALWLVGTTVINMWTSSFFTECGHV